MSRYLIGRSPTGENIYVPANTLNTHTHLVGATGSGKSTFIVRLVTQIMMSIFQRTAIFVIDPLGGLVDSLLEFMASPYCPDSVRDRLVYIEPARTEYVMPFNPLDYTDEYDLYVRTGRISDAIVRTGRSSDMAMQLRLRRWIYNTFYTIAALGYPPAAAQFLLQPGTPQNKALLSQIPPHLRTEWSEVLNGTVRDQAGALDSSRNRLAAWHGSPSLRYMLASLTNKFDTGKFIDDASIVLINLSCQSRVDPHVSQSLGRMFLGNILSTVRTRPPVSGTDVLLVLDEFQNFIIDDLSFAIPEMRQLRLKLLLSHQSFSQLEQGEIDLSSIVFQARNRIMFANDAADADLMAAELASYTFDPLKIKDQIEVLRQRKVGQSLIRLHNFSASQNHSVGNNSSHSESKNESGSGVSEGSSSSEGFGESTSAGWSEKLVDNYEDFHEVSSRSYYSFDEQMRIWSRTIRRLKTGNCLAKFRDDDRIHEISVDRVVVPKTDELVEAKAALLHKNFSNQNLFLPEETVKQGWYEFVEKLGSGQLEAPNSAKLHSAKLNELRLHEEDESDFR